VRIQDCRKELVNLVTQTAGGDKQHIVFTKVASGGDLVGSYAPAVVPVKASSSDDGIDNNDNLAMMTGEDVQNCFRTNVAQFGYDDCSLMLASSSFDTYQADVDSVVQANLEDDMMSFLSPSSMSEPTDPGNDYISQPGAMSTASNIYYN
jgi:hypothetical protein